MTGGLAQEVLAAGLAPPAGDRPREDRARESFVERGGWYWQASDGSLRYRPRGHADPFVRAWLDLAGELAGGPAESAREPARALFAALAGSAAPGRCALCHSVDELPGAHGPTPRMNWTGWRAQTSRHPPTRFAHRPHLSLQDRQGCTTCHAPEPDADYAASFAHRDPQGPFASGFRPMPRTLCASCHTRDAAGDACTSCHRYHWGEFAPAFAASPEGEPIPEAEEPPAETAPDAGSDADELL